MTRRSLLATHRHLFLLLVGLGLLARVLVPVGWMPHVGNGEVRLVLCAGNGPVTVQAPTTGHHASPAATHGGHDMPAPEHDKQAPEMGAPCPFTVAAAPALFLDSAASITPLLPVAPARWTAFVGTRASRLAAPPPPAIGPPAA